jgi:F-type H+-transporting ATPase subunit a
MHEHELWVTRLFNDYLPGAGNALLSIAGLHAHNPERPWANFVTMQIFVALILIVLFAVLRTRLSMDRPGTTQHIFEVIYEFISSTTDDIVGHHGRKFLHLFASLFIFILFSNLIGIIPSLESPTMFPQVPLGCALVAFLYYNGMGVREQGIINYAKHFAGPVWWLAPLMIPIEIVSHLARPLSLTIRLYANMFAGEQVTLVFLGLVAAVVPVVFMGLHVFVSFLQAYIFTLLTMVYVGSATEHEH